MAAPSQAGVKRVLSKLESCINSGNYYEAHQMYRTLYFRYLSQKKYTELIRLLFEGSKLLLDKQQQTSGADLGVLLIDVLIKSKTQPSGEHFDKIAELFALMNPSSPERDTFVQKAIQWSSIGCAQKAGHADLHLKVAKIYWKEKNYTLARNHFLCTKSGVDCALMILEVNDKQGYADEVDLYIAQIVLQFLCLQKKDTAKDVFNEYVARHPKINSGPPYVYPLLNFLYFLFQAIDSHKTAHYAVLCQQYTMSVNRDPCYMQYLDKIGQLFFNVPPKNQSSKNVFSSLLQSFFNGPDEDDDQDGISSFITPEID